MRISMSLSLMFAVVLCASISVRADDNAAQAAARAALLQKMQEMDSGQSDNSMSPPMAPAPATENQAPAPVVAEPQPETKPEPPAPVEAPPMETAPQTQNTAPVAPVVAPPANSAQAEEQAIISQHAQAPANVLPPSNDMSQQQPAAEMPARQKRGFFSHILHPFHENNRKAVTQERRMKPAAREYSDKNNSGFAPVVAPPPPVSPEQDAQLQALLEKYKANQISPEQYQSERAAIIGPR